MTGSNTVRHAFLCSDDLWEALNNLAAKTDQTIDDIICDALNAMLKSQQSEQVLSPEDVISAAPEPSAAAPAAPAPVNAAAPIPQIQTGQPPIPPPQPYSRQPVSPYNRQPVSPSYTGIPAASSSGLGAPAVPPPQHIQSSPLPPAPPIQSFSAAQSMQQSASNFAHAPSSFEERDNFGRSPSSSHIPAAAGIPSPGAQNSPQSMMQMSGQPPLYITFANQRYTVDKDKFIIGRSSQLADLVIRDGNISRKHCAIIYKGGAYYIKDLDSTNGIEYKGKRIDTKRIDEGDVFNICEFQFSFTYHS